MFNVDLNLFHIYYSAAFMHAYSYVVISFNIFKILLPGSLDRLTVYFCLVLKKRSPKTTQQMRHKCHAILLTRLVFVRI